jgi:hypothetical protein
MERIKIDNKYEVVIDWGNGGIKALRYGEEWRNLNGDNLVLAMAYRIQELEEKSKVSVDYNVANDAMLAIKLYRDMTGDNDFDFAYYALEKALAEAES